MRAGLGLLAAVLAALAVYGYAFELGSENQPLQIPAIERRVDPTLFPGDLLVPTLDRYPSIFFPLATAVRRQGPLELPLFYVHLATLAGAAGAIWAIAGLFGASRAGRFLGALLLLLSPLVRPALFSRDTIVAHWVTPTTISFPILLLALYFLLRGRSGWAGVLAGIGAQVNAVTAGLFFCAALLATLAEPGRLARSLRLAAGFFLLALPILIQLPHGALAEPSGSEFMALLAGYYPYHFFPSAQPPHIYPRLALLIAGGLLAAMTLPRSAAARRALKLVIAVLTLCVAGAVFAELWPVASVTKLHLLRADRWFYVLLCAVLGTVAGGIRGASSGEEGGVDAQAGTQGAPFRRWSQLGVLAIAAGALRGAYPVIGCGVILSALARPPWPALLRFPLAALAMVLALVELGFARAWGSALLVSGLAVAVFLPRMPAALARWPWRALACGLVLAELLTNAPTLGPRGFGFARPSFSPEWREIQDWAAHATPPAARFLTPPAIPGFRVYSRRSTVVERKDGAAMLWTPAFGPAWKVRLGAVEGALAARDTTRLWTVARRFGADYAVVERALVPPGLTPVHLNAGFAVLAVPPAAR